MGFSQGCMSCAPPNPTDAQGSHLGSTLVLSSSTKPQAGLCRGPSPQPDLFSSSPRPARVESARVRDAVNKGMDDCSSAQPEGVDERSPLSRSGGSVASWPMPARRQEEQCGCRPASIPGGELSSSRPRVWNQVAIDDEALAAAPLP